MNRWIGDSALAQGRLSGGYTLDEAARLYRSHTPERGFVCPACGVAMWDASQRGPSGGVSLVRCTSCGRGLVLEYHVTGSAD